MSRRFDPLKVLVAAAVITVALAIPLTFRARQRAAFWRAEAAARSVQLREMKDRSQARKGAFPWKPARAAASPSR